MLQIKYLLAIIFIFNFDISDADANCNYEQKITRGYTYSITNPNYPNPYDKSQYCRWHAVSDLRIKMNCELFNIPSSRNCTLDSLNVFPSSRDRNRIFKYCGAGNFSIESEEREMLITLTTSDYTPGGIFNCHLTAIEDISVNECKCGWKKPTKIVGGEETEANEYPMMAVIINLKIQQVYCSATIISPKHILTAAHCVNGLTVEDIFIVIGGHDLTKIYQSKSVKTYHAQRIILHPSYVPTENDYDIAIVTLNGIIKYTNEIGPACLPIQHARDSFGGSFVDLLGYGTTEFGGDISTTLQKAQLSVTNQLSCKPYYSDLTYRQVCTYTAGKDACQFDSGGPVLWQNPTSKRIVLIGIISYGISCASDIPGVNTRVGSFIDWIIESTPGVVYCPAE